MNITKGKGSGAPRLVVYGPSGVGKSSFACGVDHPATTPRSDVLALDWEHGLEQIGPARIEGPRVWLESLALIRDAALGHHEYGTIVIDTVDSLEPQLATHICRTVKGPKGKSCESLVDYGYGDGYEILVTHWREMLFVLEGARALGRQVILVAHVKRDNVDDPQIGRFSKYVAAMAKLSWGATHRWADGVLFCNYEQGVSDKRVVMVGRKLYTEAGSGFDAKNRWGLPAEMPLSWAAFESARTRGMRSTLDVLGAVNALDWPADQREKIQAYVDANRENVDKLLLLESSLKQKNGEQK
jgi:hypothetical protein